MNVPKTVAQFRFEVIELVWSEVAKKLQGDMPVGGWQSAHQAFRKQGGKRVAIGLKAVDSTLTGCYRQKGS